MSIFWKCWTFCLEIEHFANSLRFHEDWRSVVAWRFGGAKGGIVDRICGDSVNSNRNSCSLGARPSMYCNPRSGGVRVLWFFEEISQMHRRPRFYGIDLQSFSQEIFSDLVNTMDIDNRWLRYNSNARISCAPQIKHTGCTPYPQFWSSQTQSAMFFCPDFCLRMLCFPIIRIIMGWLWSHPPKTCPRVRYCRRQDIIHNYNPKRWKSGPSYLFDHLFYDIGSWAQPGTHFLLAPL